MPDLYTYQVHWSVEDGEYVATALEFPSLSHLDSNPNRALDGIRQLVTDVVADLRDSNEEVPQPLHNAWLA